MKSIDVVEKILRGKNATVGVDHSTTAFAPSNIALCKYWGKRDQALNLPVTSSLSISLGDKGTRTQLTVTDDPYDTVILNHQPLDKSTRFHKRLTAFLDLLPMRYRCHFRVETESNIPIASGLASSASGFAAVVVALDTLFDWQLRPDERSILARLGSGSACRSLWHGFVEWQAGERADGMDSFAMPLAETWPELCIGLCIVSRQEKPTSSRDAMQRTVETSPFYARWPEKVATDLPQLKKAIRTRDFTLLGKTAESNAFAMHATMMSAWPPIMYAEPETIETMKTVWRLRGEGLAVYMTQDAGPNVKLLFLERDMPLIKKYFPDAEIVQPFLPNEARPS